MTAINWLIEKLEKNKVVSQSGEYWNILKEEAKRMEKEQIIIAFDIGSQDQNRIGKEYYNDLYAD